MRFALPAAMELKWRQVRTVGHGLPWCLQSADGRFVITETTFGCNLLDRQSGEIIRLFSVQGAKAIASARVGDDKLYITGGRMQ